ncbi:MAG: pentapeptide repeat-containing protein [Armatimonadota bacterium]
MARIGKHRNIPASFVISVQVIQNDCRRTEHEQQCEIATANLEHVRHLVKPLKTVSDNATCEEIYDVSRWNAWRAENQAIIPRLERLILRGAHFETIDFAQAHLEETHLEGAHLEGAHLEGAHLEGAHLEGAHLEGAHLEGAHLDRAYLEGAHLEGAHLEGAHLEGAHLEGAHLEGAHLDRAYLEGAHLEGAHLNGALLPQANLRQASLDGAYLRKAILVNAFIEGCSLKTADLEEACLQSAHISMKRYVSMSKHISALWMISIVRLFRVSIDYANSNIREAIIGCVRMGHMICKAIITYTLITVTVMSKMVCLTLVDLTKTNLIRARRRIRTYRHIIVTGSTNIHYGYETADLRAANFTNAYVLDIRYDREAMIGKCHGIRVDTCRYNAIFKRDAQDQDYIDTMELRCRKGWRKILFSCWRYTDYGRSIPSVAVIALVCILVFGGLYYIPDTTTHIINGFDITPLYFSVVTFTTLGYGDISANNTLGQCLVAVEVALGYITLGLILAILANTVARRS